ncbi:MAG: MFS transporter, partial [Pseudomonadales bacterium]|nr:MFS transporter [Pseudomonadales bacterium]
MQRYILALLMTMVVLSPMAIDIYLASVVEMAAELQASNSQIQSTISLFFLAMGLGQVVVGPLADRYGRKPIAVLGLALYLCSSFAASLVGDILMMQLVRMLQGFAACAISVIIFSIVRDTYSYERSSKVYSYLNGVLSVIPALAPIFGSALAESFGWRSTFVFMGSYALLVLCLVARFLPETLKASTEAAKSGRLYNWQLYRPVLCSRYF